MLKQGNKIIIPSDEFANLTSVKFSNASKQKYLKEIAENGTPSK